MWRIIVSVLLIIVPTLIFGLIDKPVAMAIILLSGFLSAVIINIDKFDSFKAGQIEAKLKKAERIIDEATATIEQLESVTIPLLNSSLSILIYDGVFDGMNSKEKEKTLSELMKIKKVINADSDYTNEVLYRATNSVANFYFHDIKSSLTVGRDKFDEYFSREARIDHEPHKPAELDKFFTDNPETLTAEVKLKLDKYSDFIKGYYE